MLSNPFLKYPQDIPTYSSLPNIHPQSLHCLVRSQSPDKGSLYVSNLEAAQSPEILKKLKVTSVLTCAEGYRLEHAQDLIPNYNYFPLSDNPIFHLQTYFEESADFLKNALSKSNCLVHCLTGQNKSIVVVIAYLIKNYSMSLDDALAYAKRKIKLVNINQTYIQALKQFSQFLKNKISSANKTDDYTLSYKTQNSHFEGQTKKDSVKHRQSPKSYSQSRASKNSQINQSRADPLKNTAITFNKQEKLQTHSSQITSHHHSRYATRSPQINSNPNSKDLSNYPLQNHIEKSKTQASKVMTEKKSRYASFSLDHKEAMHFQQIFSSAHQDYIGVKRQQKNSSLSSRKQKGNIINFSSNQNNSQFEEPLKNLDFLKVQNGLTKSKVSESRRNEKSNNQMKTQRSQQKSLNKTEFMGNNSRMNTKRTQIDQDHYSQLRILNPQNNQANCYRLHEDNKSSMRMKSRQSVASLNGSKIDFENNQIKTQTDNLEISKILSPAFELAESRRNYFSTVNEQLNSNVKEICSSFDTDIANCRINYQNRLRQLKESGKSKTSTECASPLSPIF